MPNMLLRALGRLQRRPEHERAAVPVLAPCFPGNPDADILMPRRYGLMDDPCLDERLLAEAKKHAAETGRTLIAVLEDTLRETSRAVRRGAKESPYVSKTVKGDGVRPGVDLDDTAALLDLMDGAAFPTSDKRSALCAPASLTNPGREIRV